MKVNMEKCRLLYINFSVRVSSELLKHSFNYFVHSSCSSSFFFKKNDDDEQNT